MLNKNKTLFLLLLFAIIVILMPGMAHAADLFEIQDGDKSKELFLDALFNSDNLEGSPLNEVILTFNTCVLMLGGVLAAYTLIVGTMSTAHDGEMLGKKWSAMWLPIRTTIGAAFIFPTVGGFCTAQIIVIWLIHQGIGLADTLWSSYLDKMPQNSVSSFNGPDRVKVFKLAEGILQSEYCTIVANKYYDEQAQLSERNKDRSQYPTMSFFTDNDKKANAGFFSTADFNQLNYYYGFNDLAMTGQQKKALPTTSFFGGVTRNACGQVTFDFSSSSINSTTGDFSLTSLKNFADASAAANGKNFMSDGKAGNVGSRSEAGMQDLSSVNKAKLDAIDSMRKNLGAVALQFYNADNKQAQAENLYNALNKETLNYISASKTAASKLLTTTNKDGWSNIADTMKKDGWLYAGSWYMQLYRIQSLISNISKVVPSYTAPSDYKDITRKGDSDKITAQMTMLNTTINTFSEQFDKSTTSRMLSSEYEDNVTTLPPTTNPDGSEAVERLTRPVTSFNTSLLEAFANDNEYNDNPLGLAFRIGDSLEVLIWGIITASAVGGSLPFIGGGVVAVATLFSSLMGLMFLVSNMLTVVLPFMPFFLWLGAILGWAMLCIEAIIAAPLWIMIHIHPDGDGVVGRGGAGYGMVLSLTVRPALMIIGLICALVCIGIFANMVNELFMTAFYTIASRSGISLLQTPIILGTYAMALYVVIKKSFSLIHVIPDEILKWLGVNSHNSVEKSSTGGIQAMMAARTLDDTFGKMSLKGAMDAGKEVNKAKDKSKEGQDQIDAISNVGSEMNNLESAASDPELASAHGKDNDFGENIQKQNQKADGIINGMSNKPTPSMSPEDRTNLYNAHKVKAENAENLMKSNAVEPGSANYQALEKTKNDSEAAMKELSSGNTPTSAQNTSGENGDESSSEDVGGDNPGQNEQPTSAADPNVQAENKGSNEGNQGNIEKGNNKPNDKPSKSK